MSNAIYPTLPGLAFGVQRTVLAPPVTIKTTPSRREFVARDATVPLYQYSLIYEFLRSSVARTDLQTLVGFYNARGGPFDSFLFKDPDDFQATAQLFGTGNASTTTYQLVRSFGGFAEAVFDLVAAPSIYINGALQASGYTVSGTGLVTFSVAPGAGQPLTWTGQFYRRCRFANNELSTTKFMQDLWEAKRVDIMSKKA